MLSIIIGAGFSAFETADAASARTPVRVSTATSRRPATTTVANTSLNTTTETLNTVEEEPVSTTEEEPEEIIIENKSSSFDVSVSAGTESSVSDNSFAEQIRKQRAAFEANEATSNATNAQKNAAKTSSNSCDSNLRKCMATKCGNDFTKCALDGDTIFGDKLNACRRDTECTGEEFSLFTAEIKADRDMNVRLASYNNVINCGNQYNACLVNECGKTYNKCLGKAAADAAIKKCGTIAKECTEADSGLANRFGTVIGKLRENAEKEVKKDDERMYAMRDSMQSICKRMGAMFDERTFDCVFTVNFFAGNDQKNPMASRKRYAGDTFVCMQEWFGVNVTTYKENAYRETRAQTGASSALLGAGVGTAAGLVTSGAIGRAIDTQKAKKDFKSECKSQGGTLKGGECVFANRQTETSAEQTSSQQNLQDAAKEQTGSQQSLQDAAKEQTGSQQSLQDAVAAQKKFEAEKEKEKFSDDSKMLEAIDKIKVPEQDMTKVKNNSTETSKKSTTSAKKSGTKNKTTTSSGSKAKSNTSSSSSNTKKTTTSSGNKTNEPKKSEFVKMLENNQQNFSWK